MSTSMNSASATSWSGGTSQFADNSSWMTPQHDVLFSFAAAGWLQMYHFGAGKALQDTGLASLDALKSPSTAPIGVVRFAGSSAGALAASALVVGTDFDALREYACACAVDCRSSLLGALNLRTYVRRGVELFATGAFKAATQRARETRRAAIEAKRELARQGRQENVRRRRRLTRDGEGDDFVGPQSRSQSRGPQGPGDLSVNSGSDGEDSGYESDENRDAEDVFDDGEYGEGSLDPSELSSGAKEDLSALLKERLEVYATTLPFLTAKKFTRFDEVDDLDEALTASCLLVPLAGLPFRVRETKEWVMDGGIAAFQPRAGERGVVTLSAMYFASADIKPSIFVPVWWGLYPPSDAQYRSLFALGYNDCLDGLLRKRLITPEIYSACRGKYPNDASQQVPKRGAIALARDALAFFFFMFILRPLGLLLVYLEMFIVIACSAAVAMLHDILPNSFGLAALVLGTRTSRRRDGTRKAAWTDVYLAARNLVSMRVPFHLIVGSRIPVNARRLERYSRVYRALRPFLG